MQKKFFFADTMRKLYLYFIVLISMGLVSCSQTVMTEQGCSVIRKSDGKYCLKTAERGKIKEHADSITWNYGLFYRLHLTDGKQKVYVPATDFLSDSYDDILFAGEQFVCDDKQLWLDVFMIDGYPVQFSPTTPDRIEVFYNQSIKRSMYLVEEDGRVSLRDHKGDYTAPSWEYKDISRYRPSLQEEIERLRAGSVPNGFDTGSVSDYLPFDYYHYFSWIRHNEPVTVVSGGKGTVVGGLPGLTITVKDGKKGLQYRGEELIPARYDELGIIDVKDFDEIRSDPMKVILCTAQNEVVTYYYKISIRLFLDSGALVRVTDFEYHLPTTNINS